MKPKLLYIYLTDFSIQSAEVIQTSFMLDAFTEAWDVTLLTGKLNMDAYLNVLENLRLEKKFEVRSISSATVNLNSNFELSNRLIFNTLALKYLNQFDVIYTRDFSFLYFQSLIPSWLRTKTPIVFEIHKLYHKTSAKVSFNQESKALKIPNLFASITNGIKDDMIQFFAPEQKIEIFPSAIDKSTVVGKTSNDLEIISKFPHLNKKTIIAYFGSFESWKGVDIIINALPFVKKNENVIFFICGGIDPNYTNLKKLLLQNSSPNLVILEGKLKRSDAIQIMQQTSIALVPNDRSDISTRYTSPLKIFEYMACGCAIIASNLPAMREILEEDKNCLFFEAGNHVDLANKIDYLLSNQVLRDQIIENNKRKIVLHTWDRRAAEITKFMCVNLQILPK